jgi:S1-C subfamily serine protease
MGHGEAGAMTRTLLLAGCVAAATFAEVPGSVRSDESARVAVMQRVAPSVVCIFGSPDRSGGGSGVVISPDGLALTNVHVVAEFLESRRGFGGLADGRLYPLRVIGIDPGGDIALVRMMGRESFAFSPLGDSDKLRLGQPVFAMGNPFVLAEDFAPTSTFGMISGLHRYQSGQGNLLEYADCIQVSTSINPGNSGGPLFDMHGCVIGINGRASFGEDRGRVNVGIGYAVTANQIRRFLPGLRAGRLVEHGTLGATVKRIGNQLVIDQIQDLSPAERAGLRLGDELLAVGDAALATENDFNNRIALLPTDWPVTLRFRRDGKEYTGAARLERLPARMSGAFIPDAGLNQRELRAILARFRSDSGVAAGSFEVTGRGGATPADAAAFTWLSSHPDVQMPGVPADVAREWTLLMTPLLADPPSGRCEFVGGDEVAGRICDVIEQRIDSQRRVRWRFDTETARLLEAEFASDDTTISTWNVRADAAVPATRFPGRWTRRADAASHTIEIERFAERAEP